MKKNLQLLTTLLLTFALPLLTSWLLDWCFIAAHWTRVTLVVLLMAIEFALGVIIIYYMTEDERKPRP